MLKDFMICINNMAAQEVPDIKELPQYLKSWIAVEEEISAVNTTLREKRKKSKALKETILRIMQGNKVQQINTNKGAVVDRKRKLKEAISAKFMRTAMKEYFQGDEDKTNKIFEFVENKRSEVEKHDLKLQKEGQAEPPK
jgi:Family of unknown function (DUF5760)